MPRRDSPLTSLEMENAPTSCAVTLWRVQGGFIDSLIAGGEVDDPSNPAVGNFSALDERTATINVALVELMMDPIVIAAAPYGFLATDFSKLQLVEEFCNTTIALSPPEKRDAVEYLYIYDQNHVTVAHGILRLKVTFKQIKVRKLLSSMLASSPSLLLSTASCLCAAF